MKKAFFPILTALSLIGICSCGDSESVADSKESGCTPEKCLVYTVYSQAGIGDFGYQDLIYYGVNLAKETQNFSLENAHPNSVESAEDFIKVFFEETDSGTHTQRLLILTTGEFDTLFASHPEWKQNSVNTILILGPREKSIDAHFWDISLYGASYLAGRTVKDMGLDSAIILAANPKTPAIRDAVSGFITGYEKSNGHFDIDKDLFYLDDEDGKGFNSQTSYFIGFNDTSFTEKTFIFPVMGGSNQNLYRNMREMQDSTSILSCGMDANQEHLSTGIAFSIEKKIDALVIDFTEKWVAGDSLKTDVFATFGTKYIDIAVSKGYKEWTPHFEKFKDEAEKAEQTYLEKR